MFRNPTPRTDRSAFYLIPIMIGMAGVLFAGQLEDPLLRWAVVLLCLGVPLFVGGNVLARYSMGLPQRIVLSVGMTMLVVGAVYSELGYADIFGSSEFVSPRLRSLARHLGLGSLLLGLSAVLYTVIRSQALMTELSERFQHLSDHMSDGFLLTDDKGVIVLVNSSFLEMTGLPKEKLIGADALSLAKSLGAETVARHTRHRSFGIASEYRVTWELEDGVREYRVHGTPVFDRRGSRVGALATVRDITEKERMSKQLAEYAGRLQDLVGEQTQRIRASEEQIRNLLLHMNEGFATLDGSHRIRFVNERLCTMLRRSSESLSEARFMDFVAVEDRARVQGDMEAVASGGAEPEGVECALLRQDGSRIPIKIAMAAVKDGSESAVVSVVITDLEDLKAMQYEVELRARQLEDANEELVKLDRAKDVFLSNVSHELRTPLTTVQGYVEMWEQGDIGEVNGLQDGALKVMGRNLERLSRLINEMIEFSRMEIRGVKLYKTLFRPERILQECVSSARPQALQKDISVNLYSPESMPEIWGDREKLGQVLSILLSNAIKFSSEGSLVQIRVEEGSEGEVIFSVSDTGIGIGASDLERVFAKFYQVDSSYTRHYQGTGIGLSIARSIVEAHDGEIALESALKTGSTFSVSLPHALFRWGSESKSFVELKDTRVLVAAEQGEFREAVAAYLRRGGCEVATFAKGHECVRAAGDEPPDIVLIDEILSDLPGADLLALLREDLRNSTTPVLLLSSNGAQPGSPNQQIFDRVWEIRKPFSADGLVMKVLKVCALSGEIGEAWAESASTERQ